MRVIPAGRFWVGGDFNTEEQPNFETALPAFCMDRTEVTVGAYRECVASGKCSKADASRFSCNARLKTRDDHPINCVSYKQAEAFCAAQDARLPTEIEWEYAARGGDQARRYSWGDEEPDTRACWKQASSTCKVGSYPAGAFGLVDMTGNVWEWTSSWFTPYPWPSETGHARVYRGGSWSRRFVKWMRPQLRNRYPEHQWGAHLGFRCAKSIPSEPCPFGEGELGCRHGVLNAKCPTGSKFNGVRCAKPGAPHCHPGFVEKPGYGCVPEHARPDLEGEQSVIAGVSRQPSPEFDADCRAHYPGRHVAYQYTGGNHVGRNQVSRQAGCKNRDVGAGWNSCCCP